MDDFFSRDFDFVCSLGWNCACATYLRRHRLRDCSSPFDWLIFSTFEARIRLLETHFAGFLEKANLHRLPPDVKAPRHGLLPYEDRGDGFVLFHEFPENQPFDEAYEEVHAKYARRIARLYWRVASSQRVLFVWRSPVDHLPAEELVAAQERLSRLFSGSEISLLVVENDMSLGAVREESLAPRVLRLVGPIVPDIDVPDGDVAVNNRIFSRIRSSVARAGHRRDARLRLLVKLLSWPHFSKAGRAEARRRWMQRLQVEM